MGFFRDRSSWEERQTEKLRGLREKRIKEESRGKLREIEVKERGRIEKAKAKGKGEGTGWRGKAGKIGEGMGKAAQGMGKASEYGKKVGSFGDAMSESFANIGTGGPSMGGMDPFGRSEKKTTKPRKRKRSPRSVTFHY